MNACRGCNNHKLYGNKCRYWWPNKRQCSCYEGIALKVDPWSEVLNLIEWYHKHRWEMIKW